MDTIAVLDFGSQYSHLICRRIRELGVYAELVPYDTSKAEIAKINPRGIILSGGPASVHESGSPRPDSSIFEMDIPVLGICYGHQIIVEHFGGRTKRANREYGSSTLNIDEEGTLLGGLGGSTTAWMSHGDEAEKIPDGFSIIGHTEDSKSAAISNAGRTIYGIQFHPEVAHTKQGSKILENFVLGVCGIKREWTMDAFVERAVSSLKKIEGRVLCGVSGGIDSTVTALLIHRAIGDRLSCIFVDNGLLREGERAEIESMFGRLGVPFEIIDASARFLDKLAGIVDPEQKRMIIGAEFVSVFTEFAKTSGPFRWLAQGTLYPDVIESGVSGGPASMIKTHHNVGGLPQKLGFEVLEPLRELYKDEVRRAARILGVDPAFVGRHPFPGPGLAVRIIGAVTPEKLRIARKAGHIVESELKDAGLYDGIWQAYAAVGDDRAVGVLGDARLYGRIVTIRIVDSTDAMTADWTRLPYKILSRMSDRITNEVDGVSWVTYAISSKPPATIEPQ